MENKIYFCSNLHLYQQDVLEDLFILEISCITSLFLLNSIQIIGILNYFIFYKIVFYYIRCIQ